MKIIHFFKISMRFLIVYLFITVTALSSASGKDEFPGQKNSDPQTNPFSGQRVKQSVDRHPFNPRSGQPGSDSMGQPFSKTGPGRTPGEVTPNQFPGQPGTMQPGTMQPGTMQPGRGPGAPSSRQTGPGRMPGGASSLPIPGQPGRRVQPGMTPGQSPGDTGSQTQTSSDPPVFDVQTQTDGEQFISIDFNNVDISILIKFMSELTGKNFVVDHRVRGKVTIISPSRISVSEAYKVFESVLEVHGFATVKAGKIIKIIPSPDARAKNIETMLEDESHAPEDKVVTQLIPLRYADAAAIKRIIAPLISKSSVALAYAPTNTLILTDFYSNIRRLLKILKTIDVTGVGRQLSVIPLEYADATKFVKLLSSIFKKARRPKKGVATTADEMKFVADERTNTIILLASEDETKRIKNLIALLDKQTPPGDEKIRVYYLEHATAEELAEVLQSLSGKQRTTGKKKGKKTSPVVSENVKITADKGTNSLIIMADKDDYRVLEEIIRKLDIPREMVYIEGLYMDVNTDKDFGLGVEWLVGGAATPGGVSVGYGSGFSSDNYANLKGLGGLTENSSGVAQFPTGFSVGVIGEAIRIGSLVFPSLGAIIKAYQHDRDIHILAKPQVLVSDNEEAIIHVGQNIPYQTKSGTAGNNESYNTYEYKDIGMTLKITPQINKNRMLKLEISQKVEALNDLVQTSSSDRPTTFKRTVETTVVVKDGHTVVLGGMIDDSFSQSNYKVPCLGDIPGLGWLFKVDSRSREKKNLYFFLTPHVVENPAEAQAIYEDKKKSMGKVTDDNIDTPQNRQRNLQTGEMIKENLTDSPAEKQKRYNDKRMGTDKITGGKIEMNRRNLRTGEIIKDNLVEKPAEAQKFNHDESMEDDTILNGN